MAIINLNLELDKINKEKVIHGKKGKYLNITIATYYKTDPFVNNFSIFHSQSKEERQGMVDRQYLGNGRVVAEGEVFKAEQKQEQPKEESSSVDFDFI